MTKKDFISSPLAGAKQYVPWIIGMLVLVFFVIAFFIFDFRSNKSNLGTVGSEANSTTANGQQDLRSKDSLNQQLVDVYSDSNAINDLIKKLGKHIYLPTGKVTITTVVDADALRKDNPVFYQYAKKGDRVVLYPTVAILYDPVVDLVLDVAHFAAPTEEVKK